MRVVGLTGSIASGKSTVASILRARGVPVFDADQTVHLLYAGEAAPKIEAAFPGTAVDGVVDRDALAKRVLGDREALTKLEAIVHPLVRAARASFLDRAKRGGAALAVLEIPLLFETGAEKDVDAVVVASAPEATLRSRALARPGMSEEKLDAILSRQTLDAEKRTRADFVVDTSGAPDETERQVDTLIETLRRFDPRIDRENIRKRQDR